MKPALPLDVIHHILNIVDIRLYMRMCVALRIQPTSHDLECIQSQRILSMDNASRNGDVDTLDWWLQCAPHAMTWTTMAMDHVSGAGKLSETDRIRVLSWWRDNVKGRCKYSLQALVFASTYGYTAVLDWWAQSPFVFTGNHSAAISAAGIQGHVNVLDWWASYIPIGEWAAHVEIPCAWASQHGSIAILDWWKANILQQKISAKSAGVHLIARYAGGFEVLSWLNQNRWLLGTQL